MRKNLLFALGVVSAFAFASCTSTNKAFQSSPVISREVTLDPIKADIEIPNQQKIKGESTSKYFLFFRVEGDNTYADGINYNTDATSSFISKFNPFSGTSALGKAKAAAAYKAISSGDYDFIISPSYTSTVTSYLGIVREYRVQVTGYGAKYKNFRTEKEPLQPCCCNGK